MAEHRVEWKLEIDFKQEGVKAIVTGEGTKFQGEIVKHRHMKLINNIERIMKEYILSQPTNTEIQK